ncbi:MAG: hypothetical protein IJS10_00105, partial [Alphaproteobacteria bacterium]|nr:hypothetical protein [Alphaproteobacteria bacterium]
YKDKDGKLHLAWVDVDDAYLDKAYLSSIDKKTEVTLRLGCGCDLYADEDCFRKVTVTGSAEQEDGLFMMNLANAKSKERGTIYIPHSYFVQCSDSINCIHMQCKIKTKATQIYNLISLNKNLTEATLRIEDSPNIKDVLILIDDNPNLTEANITMILSELKTMYNIMTNDTNLTDVTINFHHNTKNLAEVSNLFGGCEALKTVRYVDTENGGTNLLKNKHNLLPTKEVYGDGPDLDTIKIIFDEITDYK